MPAMSGSAWGILWLAIALKVPIIALLYLVWWAIKDPPVAMVDEGDGGSPDRDPSPHPRDRPPHPPRRGPHGPPEPVVARARSRRSSGARGAASFGSFRAVEGFYVAGGAARRRGRWS